MSIVVNGVVQAVDFRAKAAPDQYGKTHFSSITVNGSKYDCGSIKEGPYGLQLRVQKGKDWVTIEPGDTVLFAAVQNGNYTRKEGAITLVAKGNGAPPATSAPPTRTAGTPASAGPAKQSFGGGDAMQTRIENGQAFNIGCDLLISRNQPLTAANLLPILAGIHKLRAEVEAAGYGRTVGNGAGGAPAAQPAPASTTAPAAQPAAAGVPATSPAAAQPTASAAQAEPEFSDDDIPF